MSEEGVSGANGERMSFSAISEWVFELWENLVGCFRQFESLTPHHLSSFFQVFFEQGNLKSSSSFLHWEEILLDGYWAFPLLSSVSFLQLLMKLIDLSCLTESPAFIIISFFPPSYLLRGAKTLVFYSPPSHEEYFVELLSTPFIVKLGGEAQEGEDGTTETDPSEISTMVLFSRYDAMALERVVGRKESRRMCKEEKSVWRFTWSCC